MPSLARLRSLLDRVVALVRTPASAPAPQAAGAPPMPTREQALADMHVRPIAFARVDAPRVSIVIPTYGKLEFTWACLRSIAEHCAGQSFEVIVVDDAGPDDPAPLEAAARGVRFFRNEKNLGFIGACNRGAAEARGDFLLFLNNDTRVQPGWLEWLLWTFDEMPDVGLVGSRLVFPDGTMQESGGIVFRDGSAWNYGRRGDPDDDRHLYLRDVDYCSGASIMLRRALLERLGGFDALYAPAYYEDTDLAFRVRREGLRTVIQPLSWITHYEGISSGTDVSVGTKRYQVLNHEKFFARWKDVLASAGEHGVDIERQKERKIRRRVLVVAARLPSATLVQSLTRAHDVKITLWPVGEHAPGALDQLRARGVELLTRRYSGSLEVHLDAAGGLYDATFAATDVPTKVREAVRARRALGPLVTGDLPRLDDADADAVAVLSRALAGDASQTFGSRSSTMTASRTPMVLRRVFHRLRAQNRSAADRRAPAFPDGHFYSATIDADEVRRDANRIWPTSPNVLGIDFRAEQQLALLRTFPELLREFHFPKASQTSDESAFFDGNSQFVGFDGRALFAILRRTAPKRVIEVGSGYSSLLTADVNRRFFGGSIDFTCIEPYPRAFLERGISGVSRLIRKRVQDVPVEIFAELGESDVLFIDSSHVSKTGSDVNHLVFEVLPRLRVGVIVHFHNIFLPDDYPREWVVDERRGWNEQYLLRALLMHSTAFEVVLGTYYLAKLHPREVAAALGGNAGGCGSFWIRRVG